MFDNYDAEDDDKPRNEFATELHKSFEFDQDDYDSRLESQDHLCNICGNPETSDKRLAMDHDHTYNFVRGFLCSSCNLRLGSQQNIQWFYNAIMYLENAHSIFNDMCSKCGTFGAGQIVQHHKGTVHVRYLCTKCDGRQWDCYFRVDGTFAPAPKKLPTVDPDTVHVLGYDDPAESTFDDIKQRMQLIDDTIG